MVRKVLLAHSILEGFAGIVLVLSPGLLLSNASSEIATLMVSKLYGIIAIVLGLISYQIWKQFNYSYFDKMVMMILMAFHAMVGLHMNGLYQSGITTSIGGAVLHLGFGVLIAGIYWKERSLFSQS